MFALSNFIIFCVVIIVLWLLIRANQAILAAQQADWGKPLLNYIDGLNRLFCKHYHRFKYVPIKLPEQGSAVVVANHISGLDALLLIAASPRPLRFLMAREQYERWGLIWLFKAIGCIPVDRGNHPEIALRTALRALKAGEVIALFPQGAIVSQGESRKLKGGSLWLAQQTQSLIYPTFISGIGCMGCLFGAILQRSHAQLKSYPPLDWHKENHLEYLQTLLEGKENV